MKRHALLAAALPIVCATIGSFARTTTPQSTAPAAAERKPGDYPLGPDSLPQEGVPKGKLDGPFTFKSQIIANTVRRYWIHVPAQYTGDRYPSVYRNALFFADFSRSCIWVMFAGDDGMPDRIDRKVFRWNAATPADLVLGPDGDLFYVDYVGGSIRRIVYRGNE